jgi:hypothetical protein
LELAIVLPPIFYEKRRILFANSDDGDINHNTSKVIAFQRVCKKILEEKGVELTNQTDNEYDEKEIISSKQVIQLPFMVEETFWRGRANTWHGFEVIAVENDDVVLFNEMGGEIHHFFCLTVDMVKVETAARKVRGAMRKTV